MENSEESCIEPYYPSIDEELVGFHADARNITDYLVRGRKDLDVVSIVGVAGIGKTALARKTYNNPSIICHFDVRAWCSVSQTYDRRELVLQILKQITGDRRSNYVNLDYPEDILRKCLYQKRYLVVLDKIWDGKVWDDFRSCIPNCNNGSRIMITTRDEGVASYVKGYGYSDPYLLTCLNYCASWELFQKKVFQRGNSYSFDVVWLGHQIVKKCKGIPSLIIMIAEILSREREASSWLKVAYDVGSCVSDQEMSIKMIQSSYDHLPDHLKPCLLYIGLFPKNYEIPVSDLLKWWIAEEFVLNIDTLKLEELLENCLRDLVGRNLVVVSKTRFNGKMKCCIVLDQVREFCLRKITEEKFMQLIGYPDQPEEQRLCMYIHDRTMTSDIKESDQEFIVHPKFSILDRKNPFRFLNNLRLVRVLHLLDIYLDNSLPTAFQSMPHLRYLAIFVKAFDCKWVSHLLHLQTLLVRSSYIMISTAIWKMSKLRHVDINEFPFTIWEEDDIVLDNLKTIGMCSMSVADMTRKFWDKLPNLEELRLHINEFDYSSSALMNWNSIIFPSRLKCLSLSEIFLTDELVSSIAELEYLETLKLSKIHFPGEKHWDVSDNTFVQLKFLKLHRVFMTKWSCSEDSFPCLECLFIKSCPNLEEIEPLQVVGNSAVDSSFPLLEKLLIKDCEQLKEIPFSFAGIPTLRLIKLINCNESVRDSAESIRDEVEINEGEDRVRLMISPRTTKDGM